MQTTEKSDPLLERLKSNGWSDAKASPARVELVRPRRVGTDRDEGHDGSLSRLSLSRLVELALLQLGGGH
jgi:hypothetical protein